MASVVEVVQVAVEEVPGAGKKRLFHSPKGEVKRPLFKEMLYIGLAQLKMMFKNEYSVFYKDGIYLYPYCGIMRAGLSLFKR